MSPVRRVPSSRARDLSFISFHRTPPKIRLCKLLTAFRAIRFYSRPRCLFFARFSSAQETGRRACRSHDPNHGADQNSMATTPLSGRCPMLLLVFESPKAQCGCFVRDRRTQRVFQCKIFGRPAAGVTYSIQFPRESGWLPLFSGKTKRSPWSASRVPRNRQSPRLQFRAASLIIIRDGCEYLAGGTVAWILGAAGRCERDRRANK